MLSIIIPDNDYTCDYKYGSKKLYQNTQYVINTTWASELKLPCTPIEIKNYTLPIDLSGKKLLILRSIGGGDLLFISPILNLIKNIYPTCEIGFACIKEQHEILQLLPNINSIHSYPLEKDTYDRYDYVFQISDINVAQDKNVYELILEKLVGDENQDTHTFGISAYQPILNVQFDTYRHSKRIGIHPFANDPIRCLNTSLVYELYIKLISHGFEPIIIGTEREKEKCHRLNKFKWSCDTHKTYSALCNFIHGCNMIIATDSLCVHLAQALSVKTICIYGPFSPNSRVKFYRNITIVDSNPQCRCFMHQLGRCPRGFQEPPCLKFDVDSIVNLVSNTNVESCIIQTPDIDYYNIIKNEQ